MSWITWRAPIHIVVDDVATVLLWLGPRSGWRRGSGKRAAAGAGRCGAARAAIRPSLLPLPCSAGPTPTTSRPGRGVIENNYSTDGQIAINRQIDVRGLRVKAHTMVYGWSAITNRVRASVWAFTQSRERRSGRRVVILINPRAWCGLSDVARVLHSTSYDAIQLDHREFKMRVDDVTGLPLSGPYSLADAARATQQQRQHHQCRRCRRCGRCRRRRRCRRLLRGQGRRVIENRQSSDVEPPPPPPPCVCMSIHTQGKSGSDLGPVIFLNDCPARRGQQPPAFAPTRPKKTPRCMPWSRRRQRQFQSRQGLCWCVPGIPWYTHSLTESS